MRQMLLEPASLTQPGGRGFVARAAIFARIDLAIARGSFSTSFRAAALTVTLYATSQPQPLASFGQRYGRLLRAPLRFGDVPTILRRLALELGAHPLVLPLRNQH